MQRLHEPRMELRQASARLAIGRYWPEVRTLSHQRELVDCLAGGSSR